MKLNISKVISICILVSSVAAVSLGKAGETIFDFLNNFVGESSNEKKQLFDNFRFASKFDNRTKTDKPGSKSGSGANLPKGEGSPYSVNLKDPNTQISDWLTISSSAFANKIKYPSLMSSKNGPALIDLLKYQRINAKYDTAKNQGALTNSAFWFRIRGGYIYYTATQDDMNVLDAIFAKKAFNSPDLSFMSNNTASCFTVIDFDNYDWKFCANSEKTKLKWLCSLEQYLGQTASDYCAGPAAKKAKLDAAIPKIQKKTLTQPLIIIPTASKECNHKWSYENKGQDWECLCKEGREQSPIDLPPKENAILSPLKPMFHFDDVSSMSDETTIDGLLQQGQPIRIRNDNHALKILHPNMGKIVTTEGAVYVAEEVIFHTPSEHKIKGESFDMEMQVVHYGRTKGDIAKQVVLSFLFKKTPGVYNKFLDKLDFFNLPNPSDEFRDITQDFFIPMVFQSSDEGDLPTMQPFSFYTYQGSLTRPPCSEKTTHFVASDPIPLSNTVIELFKEALKKPDSYNPTDPSQMIINEDGTIDNNREVQDLNGREVFIYDHMKFGCVEYKKKKLKITPAGHYEKVTRDNTEYIYVNGAKPSGLPGSFVVSEDEAKGTTDN